MSDSTVFSGIEAAPPIEVFKLSRDYQADQDPNKVRMIDGMRIRNGLKADPDKVKQIDGMRIRKGLKGGLFFNFRSLLVLEPTEPTRASHGFSRS